MKKIFALFITAASLMACTFNFNGFGQGDNRTVRCGGDVIEKNMQLSDFDAIEVLGSADVDFIQSERFSVVVKANEEVFEYLDYEIEDGTLVIKTKDNVNVIAKEYNVTVKAPELKAMTVKGAADFDMKGYESANGLTIDIMGAGDITIKDITVPSLDVDVKGAGDIDIEMLSAGKISIDVKGAGDAKISGKADTASFSVSGAGSINARGLKCENISTTKNGVASISID